MKKIIIIAVLLVIAAVIAGSAVFFDLMRYAQRPASAQDQKRVIAVMPGQGLSAVTRTLADAGLITSPVRFKLLARLRGHDKRLQAGEYELSSRMAPDEILEIIINGRVRLYRLTIPEGYTVAQIADSVEKAGFTTAEAFMKAATDPTFIATLDLPSKTSPEGYLFPDTYHLPGNVSAEEIIRNMVAHFHSVFTPEWKERCKTLGFTVHEIVTLASIIEKETGVAEERPIISSVFHNRLKKKMRLETDPTVIYGIKDFDGNLTRKDLETPTPYNTYLIRGLPPGPIANPGAAALEAALYPADTDYLFFVARQDGTHQFSTNIHDHNRAVRKYQLHH